MKVIFQDSKGYIWIGTSNGMSKYDTEVDRFIHI
ncbi:MAG: two-component regulator propeller domain-containing protein [Romboutsia sp.]